MSVQKQPRMQKQITSIVTMADSVQWTASAEALLKEIPFFVRPAARKKIEKYARDRQMEEITDAVYEQAKAQFGRKQ